MGSKNNQNKFDFNNYLKKFKASKSSDFTHTSLGHPYGSYYIQAEDYEKFLDNYIESLENGETHHLTEKHRMISPILIDFDFRYNKKKERQYTSNHLYKLINIYTDILNDYIHLENYKIYILEKKNPFFDKEKNITKDGIHIIIPNVITKTNLQLFIRKKCLEKMKNIFENDIQSENYVHDIFDEAVIDKNNWMMYGSTKPDKEGYKVTEVYEFSNNKLNKIEETKSLKEYTKLFSIRNKFKETKLKSENNSEYLEFNEIIMDKERERLTNKQILKSSLNHKKNETIDIEIIKKLVKILKPERSKFFDSWIKLGWCLRNIDYKLLDDWIEFSQKSEKYEEGECEKKWNHMKDGNLGIGTLRYWAKTDNPIAYEKILQDDLYTLLQKAYSGTHTDVAHVIYQMYKHDFVCTSIKKNTWYEFKKHRWIASDSGYVLKMKMSNEVWKQFMRVSSEYSKKASEEEESDEQERLQKRAEKYSKIAFTLKNTTQKSNYLKESSELFYQERFEDKLDSNCTLVGFDNGVFDLETYEFRDGHPDDYISFSTNIDYIPYSDNNPINQEIMTFLSEILPKEEMQEYFLKLFSSFLSGKITSEKFHIFTGTGANGKSKIIELYQNAFGDYCGQFNVSLLTQKRVKSNDTNSELAKSKGKRFMVLQEPSEDEKMNIGFMKELTGGDRIIARGLFQDPIEFKPQAHLVLTCNHLPSIPSDDGGTWRRIRVIEFLSTFTDTPNPDNKNEFKIDTELSIKFDDWKEHFMSILIYYYKKYIEEGIYEPTEVLKCTKEYQKDNDTLKLYIEERVEKSEEGFITFSELYNDFKYWYRESGEIKKPPTKAQLLKYMNKNLIKNNKNKTGFPGFNLISCNIIDDDDEA
jgi:P4 family phage/plasmid primase-like protien